MFKNKNILVAVLATLFVGGVIYGKSFFKNKNVGIVASEVSNGEKVVIYKSPTCGCCVGYSAYLEDNNFDVEVVNQENLITLKDENNIPYDMQSCHTAFIGGYFIEGHVPMEAIDKLLSEKPDIDGIALPDMPAGSPGMPGVKSEEFIIFSLKDGNVEEFIRI